MKKTKEQDSLESLADAADFLYGKSYGLLEKANKHLIPGLKDKLKEKGYTIQSFADLLYEVVSVID